MTDKPEHTPWTIEEEDSEASFIVNAIGETVTEICPPDYVVIDLASRELAEFIIKACNAYYTNQEELEGNRRKVDVLRQEFLSTLEKIHLLNIVGHDAKDKTIDELEEQKMGMAWSIFDLIEVMKNCEAYFYELRGTEHEMKLLKEIRAAIAKAKGQVDET